MLDVHASRFYLPGGDADDIVQEARIGFLKAVRFYRGGRGSSFHRFAELCVSRQLASAIVAARRAKHQPLNEAARGDQADRTVAAVPGPRGPLRPARRPRPFGRLRSPGRRVQRARAQGARPRSRGLVYRGSRQSARTAAPQYRQRLATGEAKAPRMAGALGGVSASAPLQPEPPGHAGRRGQSSSHVGDADPPIHCHRRGASAQRVAPLAGASQVFAVAFWKGGVRRPVGRATGPRPLRERAGST
jgi:Sigma-70 region 2